MTSTAEMESPPDCSVSLVSEEGEGAATSAEMTSSEKAVTGVFTVIWALLSPLLVWFSFADVYQHQRGFKFRFGKSVTGKEPLKPGLHFRRPGLEEIVRIDMRTRTIDIEPQNLLTADSVPILVDALVFWRVLDAWRSYTGAEDYAESTNMLVGSMLRNTLSGRTLRGILRDRDGIADEVRLACSTRAEQWGVEIVNIEINDLKIPEDLHESMAAEATAAREAAAKVALAKGELDAAKLMAQAARNLNEGGDAAMAIRYLDTMNQLNNRHSNFIIYPQ